MEINMKITPIDKKYVFNSLSQGLTVYVANFDTEELLNCGNMQVNKLQGLLANKHCIFYRIDTEEAEV
jgi:hypothetical protein